MMLKTTRQTKLEGLTLYYVHNVPEFTSLVQKRIISTFVQFYIAR